MKDDKLMTVPEILDVLSGISRRTFYRWREIGKAPQGFKLPNGEIRIYRSELTAWLEDLREAAKRGEPFDMETGLPMSMLQAKSARTIFDFVRAYIEMKWPHAAAKTRDSISDALSTALPALVKDRPGRPDVESLRTALRKYALLPESKRPVPPPDAARVIRWLEGASLDMAALSEAKTVRLALDAIALRLDGKAASANTIKRKRAVLHALLEYAVELEELSANPLHRIKWKPAKTTETVDPRIVVNPRQAQELLTAVTYVGRRGRGRRLMPLFACMHYAALRPAEAIALRREDCAFRQPAGDASSSTYHAPRSTDSGQIPETPTRNAGSSTGDVMTCVPSPSHQLW